MLEIFLGKWIFSARVLDESSPADIVVAPSSCYFLFRDLCRFVDPELQMVSISHLLVTWDEGMFSFLDILNCQPNHRNMKSSPAPKKDSIYVFLVWSHGVWWHVIVIRYAASCPKWKKVRPKAVQRRSPKTHLRCLVPWNGRDVQGRWESLKPRCGGRVLELIILEQIDGTLIWSIRSNKCCSVLWNKEWQLISLQCQTVSNRKGWLFSFLRSGGLQTFVMAWIQNFCGGKNTIVHSKHGLFGRKLGEFLRLDLQLQPWRFGNYMKLPKRKGFLVGKKHSASEIRTDRPEKPREPGLQPSTLISLWSMRTGLEDTTRRLSFVLGFVCGKTYQKSGATMRKSLFFGGAELRSGRDFFFAVNSRFWWWCFFLASAVHRFCLWVGATTPKSKEATVGGGSEG